MCGWEWYHPITLVVLPSVSDNFWWFCIKLFQLNINTRRLGEKYLCFNRCCCKLIRFNSTLSFRLSARVKTETCHTNATNPWGPFYGPNCKPARILEKNCCTVTSPRSRPMTSSRSVVKAWLRQTKYASLVMYTADRTLILQPDYFFLLEVLRKPIRAVAKGEVPLRWCPAAGFLFVVSSSTTRSSLLYSIRSLQNSCPWLGQIPTHFSHHQHTRPIHGIFYVNGPPHIGHLWVLSVSRRCSCSSKMVSTSWGISRSVFLRAPMSTAWR